MERKSKKKFRSKIITSYLVLGILAFVAGLFILSEIRTYMFSQSATENDTKLIKTGSLLTQLYEAESLSKMALQSKTKEKFNTYTQKIDTILLEIDTIKLLTKSNFQIRLLDSVQVLLKQKVKNSNLFWDLKAKKNTIKPIDNALKEFNKMEASFGRLTIENFEKYPEKLSPYKRKVLEDWVAYLNKNIPEDKYKKTDADKIDSIINVSRSLLTKVREKDAETQNALAQKEITLNRNDLVLSQHLQRIITAFEQELNVNIQNETIEKKATLKKSIRLAGLAALLGFLTVALFTFLITKDYWNAELYRFKLEKEKKYSESLLKSREQLITTVSHDLRTPLNTITGYSELIENTNLTDKQLSYLKHVKSASYYVNSLVNDLLDFSKLEAGKINIEKIPFILSELIIETAENLKEQYHEKPIQLIMDVDSRLKNPVLGDPFRVRQIITNIISNAYKFTHEGSIKIEATIKNHKNNTFTTVIKIIDTGIGIKKEKQDVIFKEFTQAENSIEKAYGGYGLGLTISKKLTSLLNGHLALESEIDKGSIFTLSIPLEVSKTDIITSKKIDINPETALSILIIDDDQAMLHLLKEVCDTLGIRAHIFSDFDQISPSENLLYDMVLTDVQMPNINGFEVLKKLNNNNYKHYKNQSIVAMTGRKDLEIEVYKDAGFTTVLQKPFTKNSLLKVLQQLFPEKINRQQINTHEITSKTTSSLFSMEVIASFLGDDDDAIHEVISTFISETSINMAKLKKATSTYHLNDVNAISHRMLPMFRQLKANDIVPILEKLEHLNLSEVTKKELKLMYMNLQHKTKVLQLALQNYVTTLQV